MNLALVLLWRADVKRAAADDNRGIIVDVEFRDAGFFNAQAMSIVTIELAILEYRFEFAILSIVFRASLQDQEWSGGVYGTGHFPVRFQSGVLKQEIALLGTC